MKKIHNIFIKMFLLLALAMGWGGSAWAERFEPTFVAAFSPTSEDWYYFDFYHKGTNGATGFMYSQTSGERFKHGANDVQNPAFLWQVVGTKDNFKLVSLTGQYACWDNGYVTGTANVGAAATFTLINGTDDDSWAVQMLNPSGSCMNPQGSNEIKSYSNDDGCRVRFSSPADADLLAAKVAAGYGPVATEGYEIIINGDNGYTVSTTAAINSGRTKAVHGEFLDLADAPAATDLTINCFDKFVWGPAIDDVNKTITFDVRDAASSFTAGRWYQLQMREKTGQWYANGSIQGGNSSNMIDGINAITSSPTLRNKGSQLYLMSSRAEGYPIEINGYESEAYHSFVYVEAVNGNSVTLHSQNGNYVNNNGSGQSSSTAVSLAYDSGVKAFSWGAKTAPWSNTGTANWITVGMSSSFTNATGNIQIFAHPVKSDEDYAMYKVVLSDGDVATYTGSSTLYVATGAELSTTKTTIGNGDVIFLPKGTMPQLSDFTFSEGGEHIFTEDKSSEIWTLNMTLAPTEYPLTPDTEYTLAPVAGTMNLAAINNITVTFSLADGQSVRSAKEKNGHFESSEIPYLIPTSTLSNHRAPRKAAPTGAIMAYSVNKTDEGVYTIAFNPTVHASDYYTLVIPKGTFLINTDGSELPASEQTALYSIVGSPYEWVTIKNHRKANAYFSLSSAGLEANEQMKWGVSSPNGASDYWAFVGDDATGYHIINKAYGPNYVFGIESSSTGSRARMFHISEADAQLTRFDKVASNTTNEFCIMMHSNHGIALHDYSSELKVWSYSEGGHKGDTGSAFVITPVEDAALAACPSYNVYKVVIEEGEASATATYTGDAANVLGLSTIQNGRYLALKAKSGAPELSNFTTSPTLASPLMGSYDETIANPATLLLYSDAGTMGTNVTLRFVDSNGQPMTDGKVLYKYLGRSVVELSTEIHAYNFGDDKYHSSFFTAGEGYIHISSTFDAVNQILTFTIGREPNKLFFSSEPEHGQWADDTKWFTWRNNRNNNSACNHRYLSTTADGTRDDLTMSVLGFPENTPPSDRGGYWCFVGDNGNGFHIQNAAYGPDFVLACIGNKYKMVPKDNVPDGAMAIFHYNDQTTVKEGAKYGYIFFIGESETEIHVNPNDLTTYGGGPHTGDSGSSFMVTSVSTETVNALPAYDVYLVNVSGANSYSSLVYGTDAKVFGKRGKVRTGEYVILTHESATAVVDFNIHPDTYRVVSTNVERVEDHYYKRLNLYVSDAWPNNTKWYTWRNRKDTPEYIGTELTLNDATSWVWSSAQSNSKNTAGAIKASHTDEPTTLAGYWCFTPAPDGHVYIQNAYYGLDYVLGTIYNGGGEGQDTRFKMYKKSELAANSNIKAEFIKTVAANFTDAYNLEVYGTSKKCLVFSNDAYLNAYKEITIAAAYAYVFTEVAGVTERANNLYANYTRTTVSNQTGVTTATRFGYKDAGDVPTDGRQYAFDGDVLYVSNPMAETSRFSMWNDNGQEQQMPAFLKTEDAATAFAEENFGLSVALNSYTAQTVYSPVLPDGYDFYAVTIQGVPDVSKVASAYIGSNGNVKYRYTKSAGVLGLPVGAALDRNDLKLVKVNAENKPAEDFTDETVIYVSHSPYDIYAGRVIYSKPNGKIIHRPSLWAILANQKAADGVYNNSDGRNISPDREKFYVKGGDNSTYVQNTPLSKITHYVKPGETRFCVIPWAQTSDGSADAHVSSMSYQRWYNYDNEGLPNLDYAQFKFRNNGNPDLGFMVDDDVANIRYYKNGIVVGNGQTHENSNGAANINGMFTHANYKFVVPAGGLPIEGYRLACDMALENDYIYPYTPKSDYSNITFPKYQDALLANKASDFEDKNNGTTLNGVDGQILEPSLTLRYVAEFLPGTIIADEIKAKTEAGKYLEEETIVLPTMVYTKGGNVLQLANTIRDYCVYDESDNLVNITDDNVKFVVTIENVQGMPAGIVTVPSSCSHGNNGNGVGSFRYNRFMDGSNGIFYTTQDNGYNNQHYVELIYPDNRSITLNAGAVEATCDVLVKLQAGTKTYLIKKFQVHFKPNHEPRYYRDLYTKDELQFRTDESMKAFYGDPKALRFIYRDASSEPGNELRSVLMKGDRPGWAQTGYPALYAFPLDPETVPYGFRSTFTKNADWSEYMLRRWHQPDHNYLASAVSTKASYRYQLAKAASDGFPAIKQSALEAQTAAQNDLDQAAADRDAHPGDDTYDAAWRAAYEAKQAADQTVAENAGKEAQLASDLASAESELKDANAHSYGLYIDSSEAPGTIARLSLGTTLCKGARIAATAMITSGGDAGLSSSTANMGSVLAPASVLFRFMGVKDDGTTVPIYSYYPGQIGHKWKYGDDPSTQNATVAVIPEGDSSLTDYHYADGATTPTSYQSDCAWQQCYFELVNNSDEPFVDYILEVDNSCLHSYGGDVWLDDICLYWLQPVPNVEQAAPVCGNKLDLMRVTLGFDDAVKTAYGKELKGVPSVLDEVYQFPDGQILHDEGAHTAGVIQYCFGYKSKYDAIINTWREAHPGDPESTEVHAEAFWTSLLGDVNETDQSSPHFPFHQVAFSANFNDHKPFAFNDVVTADDVMKMAGRYTTNNGVRQLVFNAKVTDDDLAADDFYIFCRIKGFNNDAQLASNLANGFSDLATVLGSSENKRNWAIEFGAGDDCGAKNVFYVKPPITIVIDGSDTSDPYNVNICEGVSPQISIEANKYTELGGTAANVRRVFDWYLGSQKDLADPTLHSVTPSAVHDAAWLKTYIESQMKEDGVTPKYAEVSNDKLNELVGKTSLDEIIKAFHCCTGYNRPFPLDADGCTYFGLTSDTPLLGQAIQGELTNGAEVDYIYTLEMNDLLRRLTDDVADEDIDANGVHFVSGSDVSVFHGPVLHSYLYALQLDMSKSPEEGVNICAQPVGPEIVATRDSEDHLHYTVYCDEPQEISFRPNPIVPETTIGLAKVPYPAKLSATPIRITQSQVALLQAPDHHLVFPLRGIKPSGFFQRKDVTPPSQHRVSLLDKFKKQLNDRFKQAQEKKQKRDEYRGKSADTQFELGEKVELVVTSSNDPRWETFVTLNGTENYLPVVGTLTGLNGNYTSGSIDTEAKASITFFSETEAQAPELNGLGRYFQPREGYYYVLRANFKETAPADSYQLPQGIPEGSQACLGTLIIPLKIVPEYMEWTGAENDDWSNERNWQRADHTMLRPDATMPHQEDYVAYPYNKPDGNRAYNGLPVLANDELAAETPTVYEKQNDEYTGNITTKEVSRDPYIPMDKATAASETFGYVPVADTRIIIRRDAIRMPRLYAPKSTDGVLTNVSNMATNAIDAEYDGSDAQLGKVATFDTNGEKAGTIYIQYDMVTALADNGKDLKVVPYYTNTVKQVHIEDGAQILGQEFLKTTDGVSLDIKVDNESWYTMSSPLAGTVAGDMYLQAKGSKPTAPLFKPIGFEDKIGDNYLYDRWRPAVYQRSWDKNGQAVIVRLDNDGCDVTDARYNTEYDKTFAHWSRVYNQVEENYAARGFSVKVSLDAQLNDTPSSRPLDWSKDTPSDLPDGYVADSDYGTSIFRLPKADSSYTYYQQNGSDSKSDEKEMDSYSTAIAGRTEIADGTTGKSGDNLLYSSNRSSMDITIQNQLPGKIFLVQNPFVCGLDVAKFFEANGGFVTKFWGVEGGEAYTATKVGGVWVGSPYNDAAIIPPYRSFFVEVNGDASQALKLNYRSDMEALATLTSANQSDNNPQQPGDAPSRRRIAANNDSNLPMLTLMSCNAGGKSRAHVYVSDEAHSGFVKNEDAEVLFQSDLVRTPTIFTLADDMGTAINVTPKFYRLPLCITSEAAEGTTTTVTFTGVDAFSSALGSTVVLYDSVADSTFDLEEGTTLELPAQTVGRYFLQTGLEELAPAQDADLDGRIYDLRGIRVNSVQHGTVTISRSRKEYNK